MVGYFQWSPTELYSLVGQIVEHTLEVRRLFSTGSYFSSAFKLAEIGSGPGRDEMGICTALFCVPCIF